MATRIIHVDEKVHNALRKMSESESRPIGQIVGDLVDRYEKEQFWKGIQEDYARLRADPVAWKDYQDEVALFEGGSMDGLEDEPPYYTPEEEEEIRAYAKSQGW